MGSSAGVATEGPSWATLNLDLLAEVFSRLPFKERLSILPLVCKGWMVASSYPVCWSYLDMRDWFQTRAETDHQWEFESESTVEKLIMQAVDISCGQLRELRASHCSDTALIYIADRCPSLTLLAIPNSPYTTDEAITRLAAKCPNLLELDLSDCYNISNQAVLAVRQNCKSLVWLARNMIHKQNGRRKYFSGSIEGWAGDET